MAKTILTLSQGNFSGSQGITTAGATQYWKLATANLVGNTSEAIQELPYRTAGTISKLYVRITANSTIVTASTVTVRKNGADTGLTISIPAGTTGVFEDTTNSVTVAAGDKLDFKTVTSAVGTFTMSVVSVVFDATTNCVSKLAGYGFGHVSASVTHYMPITGVRSGTTTVEANTENTVKVDGTAKNAYLYISSNARTNNTVITLRKNGTDTALTFTIGAGVTGIFEDTSNTVSCSVDDEINWNITSGTGTESIVLANFAIDYETTTNNGFITSGCVGATADMIQDEPLTWYFPIGGAMMEGMTTEADTQQKAREAFTFKNLIIYVGANSVNATSTFSLRVNGADAITQSITSNQTGFLANTTDTTTVAADDLINYRLVTPSVGGARAMTIRQMSITTELAAALGRVENDLIVKYDIAQRVTNDLVAKYNITGRVTNDLVAKYTIYQRVTNDLVTKYNIAERITNDLIVKYNILGRITNDLVVKYNIYERIANDLVVKYDINERITNDLIVKYDIVERVISDLIVKYDISERVLNDLIVKYDIIERVSNDLITKYDILERIENDIIVKYNIIQRVTNDLVVKYNISQRVTQDLILKYDIIERVTNDLITKYNITGRTTNDLIVKYDILGRVTNDLILKYDILERIVADLIVKYDIQGIVLTRVENDLIVKYDITGRVANDLVVKYDILERIENDLISKYDILERVESDLTVKYSIFERIYNDLVVKYNIAERVISDLIVKYDIISEFLTRVESDLIVKYNIHNRVTKDLILKYSIQVFEIPKSLVRGNRWRAHVRQTNNTKTEGINADEYDRKLTHYLKNVNSWVRRFGR